MSEHPAADYLEAMEWLQCDACHREGGKVVACCAEFAIRQKYRESGEFISAFYRMYRVIHSVWISRWNDTPGRTKAEVVAAMKRAKV